MHFALIREGKSTWVENVAKFMPPPKKKKKSEDSAILLGFNWLHIIQIFYYLKCRVQDIAGMAAPLYHKYPLAYSLLTCVPWKTSDVLWQEP